MLRNHWYIACESRELAAKPLARTLLGEAVALFRDGQGRAGAVGDRCPHRNVHLSKGRVVDGCLRCPYHGWRFDAEGRCVDIPSLEPGQVIPSGAHATPYPLIEQDGYVWVWVGDREPSATERPYAILPDPAGWSVERMSAVTLNSVDNVIENFIDTCHTGYLHGGLFRQEAAQTVRTTVRAVPDGVVIDLEEQAADGLLGRLLVRKGEAITHQDRFVLPAIVRVAYGFGPHKGVVSTHLFTPEEPDRTRIYVHAALRLGLLTPLARALTPLVSAVILRQDAAILDDQGAVIRAQGRRFASVGADTANGWIRATLDRAERGEPLTTPREKVVEYRM